MPKHSELVINTGPTLALIAACGNLGLLRSLYSKVWVPYEVCLEITAGDHDFGKKEFVEDTWLEKQTSAVSLPPFLKNSLDEGEAAVIQLAMEKSLRLVAIDERVGRRVARLCGLDLTGSLGILLRAKKEGHLSNVKNAIQRMQDHGIWIGRKIIDIALSKAGES